MRFIKIRNGGLKNNFKNAGGFTLPEVMVAGMIMIILCIGLLTVFSNVVMRNRGENLRMQALSALQKQVEIYRSYKFVPGAETTADLPNHRTANLYAGTHNFTQQSEDGRDFNIVVVVTNLQFKPSTTVDEAHCIYKEIRFTATPQTAESGWLANLKTNVTIQRVRSN